jgi:exodeoxyribonuclease-1
MQNPTFYWHDYETWGANPQLDRPCQFAGLRTDADLQVIGRPLSIYAQPTADFLPHPRAVLVTGITPQHAFNQGMSEAAFAQKIHAEFSQPNTTVVGYNSINFDEEVSRQLFYRNFYDPYAYSWQEHNSRWDLIDLVRACYALRPDGIEWPSKDDGRVSMRLEDLSRANNIEHGSAHDALSDVRATIGLAQLVRKAQPKLFDYAYKIRQKKDLQQLIALHNFTPLAHVSSWYGAEQGYLSQIVPLAYHPQQANQLLYWDLRCDPAAFAAMSSAEMLQRRFTKRQELAGREPFGGQSLALNRCPFLAPSNVLTEPVCQRWQLDLERFEQHRQRLISDAELRQRIIDALTEQREFAATSDSDLMLYSGPFFSPQDRASMDIIRDTDAQQLVGLELNFSDTRIAEMLFRYRARNYPATLTAAELERWRRFCQQRLSDPPRGGLSLSSFAEQLELAAEDYKDQPQKMRLLYDLYRYVENL